MAKISYIKYVDILEARRYDAEYFKPEYLSLVKKSSNKKRFKEFRDLNLTVDASAFYPSIEPLYNTGNLPFLRVANVDKQIDYNSAVTIPEEILNDFKTIKKANYGDIVITKGGSVARLGFVDKESALSRDLIVINSSRLSPGDSKYLYFYLLSDFSNSLFLRSSSLTAQPHLTIFQVRELPLFYPEESFRKEVADLFDRSVQKQTESKQLYREAEVLLLHELGLLNYKVKHSLWFTATKQQVKAAKRYDSEYFQPKYAEIIKKIENYEGGWDFVKNQFNQNTKLSKKEWNYCNYIEISDVNTSNGEITPNRVETKDIPANGKRKLFKNDLLISKVRPYRGAVSFIDFEVENLIGSGAFTVLQEKTDFKKEVLMIFLKTQFIKDLLLRYNCGTSYPVIKDEDILNLKIPLIKPQIQKQIAEKIQESHRLRKEGKELLEEAKRKVEKEIENG